MALPEDLDALCIQQLFRAAESSRLEELDDFDLVLVLLQTSIIATLNCQHFVLKALPSVHVIVTRKSFSSPSHDLSCSAQPTRSAPTDSQIQK